MASTTAGDSGIPAPPYTFGVPWPEFNDGLAYTDVIKPSHDGSTLIDFYSTKYSNSAPLQGWIQRIMNSQIKVDGKVLTDPDSTLRSGSKLVYHRLPWKEPYAPYLLDVLYEDDDMVVINKPSGLQVLPGGLFQQRTVLSQLQWKANKKRPLSQIMKEGANEGVHPVPVHRLGRGTSGVLLCAKTKFTKTSLAAFFADGTSTVGEHRNSQMKIKSRKLLKIYRALVSGLLENDEVEIDQPIGVTHYPGVATGLYVASSSGKPAFSKVKVLERDIGRSQTLVEVEIHSGRPHQIRIHLAFIGHPLFGDPLYAVGGHPSNVHLISGNGNCADDGGYHKPTNPLPGDCGYYLHAHRLVLCHPSTNKIIDITATLPVILQTRGE